MSKKVAKFNLRAVRDQEWLLGRFRVLGITDLRETDDISLLLHGQERRHLPRMISVYRAAVKLLGTRDAGKWVMKTQKYRPADMPFQDLYEAWINLVPHLCTKKEVKAALERAALESPVGTDEDFSVPAQA